MCGLTAIVSSKDGIATNGLFSHLLMLSSFRGVHSTGVVNAGWVNTIHPKKKREFKAIYYKEAVSPGDFIRDYDFIMRSPAAAPDTKVFIGHARHATLGDVNEANAHPFLAGKILGVHNGTVHTGLRNTKDFETDSEALFNNIHTEGLEATLEAIRGSQNAYALIYIDLNDYSLNFIRNTQRPLWKATNKARSSDLFSSEKQFLEFTAARKGIVLDDYVSLDPFTLYTYDLLADDPRSTLTTREIPEAKPVPFVHTYSSGGEHGPYGRGWSAEDDAEFWSEYERRRLKQDPAQATVEAANAAVGRGSGTTHKLYAIGTGKRLTNGENFRRIIDHGCGVCGDAPVFHPDLDKELLFMTDEEFICPVCLEDESHMISIFGHHPRDLTH